MKYLSKAPIFFGPPKVSIVERFCDEKMMETLPDVISEILDGRDRRRSCAHDGKQVFVHGRWECGDCGKLMK